MITTKNLITVARTWQNMAAIGSKRISLPRLSNDMVSHISNKSSVADKGHFVIYTTDRRRFTLPFAYLSNNIFRELFKMSEEEFGFSSDGPITLPCDAVFMDYVLLLIQQGVDKDLDKALLNTSHCSVSASFHQGRTSQQPLVCGY